MKYKSVLERSFPRVHPKLKDLQNSLSKGLGMTSPRAGLSLFLGLFQRGQERRTNCGAGSQAVRHPRAERIRVRTAGELPCTECRGNRAKCGRSPTYNGSTQDVSTLRWCESNVHLVESVLPVLSCDLSLPGPGMCGRSPLGMLGSAAPGQPHDHGAGQPTH